METFGGCARIRDGKPQNGDSDTIAPPLLGKAFTDTESAAGVNSRYVEVPNTGHVELISPGTAAFEAQADLLEAYARRSSEPH